MTEPALGIDIAKLKFNVCLINKGGKPRHKLFANTPTGFEQLREWLSKQRVECLHACLEATGTYGEALSLFLYQAGHRVSVINPAAIKAFTGSRPLSHENRSRGCRVDRSLLSRASASRVDAIARRSTRLSGTCAPPGISHRDASDGRESPLFRDHG